MNLNKPFTLVCNKHWLPLRFITPEKALEDIFTPKYIPLNIEYAIISDGQYDFTNPIGITPTSLEDWLNLPIRSFDLFVRTSHRQIRVPTVVITRKYENIPLLEKRLNLRNVFEMFGGRDAYTNEPLSFRRASIDHVIPKSKGGKNHWSNVVLADKELNRKKSNKSVEEAGLTLIHKPIVPKPVPAVADLQPLNQDAKIFLKHKA